MITPLCLGARLSSRTSSQHPLERTLKVVEKSVCVATNREKSQPQLFMVILTIKPCLPCGWGGEKTGLCEAFSTAELNWPVKEGWVTSPAEPRLWQCVPLLGASWAPRLWQCSFGQSDGTAVHSWRKLAVSITINVNLTPLRYLSGHWVSWPGCHHACGF